MKNKEYYIIGSGGFAKEVYFLAENNLDSSCEFKGFIDYKPTNNQITVRGKSVTVWDEDFFLAKKLPADSINIYIGIGDPKLFEKIIKKFTGYNFPNLIDKSFVGDWESIKLGQGNIITAGCTFTVDIKVDSFNIFNLHTTIGHDTEIGNYNIFNPGSNISGSVIIGNKNLFGTNSTVLQLLSIGDENVIGAASLVTKPVDNNSVMVGVPAKKLERRI